MNKKGFTLIEILVVIALLAAISVTIGVNMSGMQERQTKKEIENYKETLEKAACVYAEISNISGNSEVTVETLLNEGLVKRTLNNPETGKTVENYPNTKISIYMENNERKCSLKTS